MSCEKQGGPYERLSLLDGSIEHVHFKPVEEILASISHMSKAELKNNNAKTKELQEADPLGR